VVLSLPYGETFSPQFRNTEEIAAKDVLSLGLEGLEIGATMTRKQRRLVLIGSGMVVLAVAVALMLNAFRDSIVFSIRRAMSSKSTCRRERASGSADWSKTALWCAE
jgi:hypothetical protein